MSTVLPPKVITSTVGRGQGIGAPDALRYAAGGTIAAYTAVGPNAAGQLITCSADTLSDALRVQGVSLGAGVSGGGVNVKAAGLVENAAWAFTPDQPVFVGLNGALTQSLPVSAVFSRVVGVAVGATRLLVNLQPPIIL
jgi:hypothetical protein